MPYGRFVKTEREMGLLDKLLQRNTFIVHRTRDSARVRFDGAVLSGGEPAMTHLGGQRGDHVHVRHQDSEPMRR